MIRLANSGGSIHCGAYTFLLPVTLFFCSCILFSEFKMPPKVAKSGPQGSVEVLSLDDVKMLISQSEERIIMSKLDNSFSSVSALKTKFNSIQTEQIRLGLEVNGVKEVIVKHQEQIERLESDRRLQNLVFSGVPESPLSVNNDTITLKNDIDKLNFLCEKIEETFDVEDIVTVHHVTALDKRKEVG